MNYLNLVTVPRRQSVIALATFLGVLCSQGAVTAADAREGVVQQKSIVGRMAALPPGFLLHRDGETWRLLPPLADVYSEDLIVAVPAGAINSKSRKVRLTMLSDLARTSPYPVLESAVVLHETDLDLDFTLDRGRVDVTNIDRMGEEAKVHVRFQKQVWELTLGPKARVAFELYGRWPAGMPFSKNPKPEQTPTLDVVLLVKEGQVSLKADGKEFAMHAPPGIAYFHWDSVPPFDDAPRRLETLPNWAKIQISLPADAAADLATLIKVISGRAKAKPSSIEEALGEILNEDSPGARRIAVYGLGATDDLPRLFDALSSNKFPDVRDVSVIALRHWIGRGEGQDIKLYDALIKKGLSEKHATVVLQLLHSFSDKEKGSPATYETLIELLGHESPAVRHLANWHLTRLVTAKAAKDINYDPLASPEEREKAAAEWKKLIPAGKLPPKD